MNLPDFQRDLPSGQPRREGSDAVTCRGFERLLNEQIDAHDAASAERLHALEAHAASCPACRSIFLRYQTLRQAIRSLGATPTPSVDFARRVLAARAAERDRATGVLRFSWHYQRVAALGLLAASLLVAAVVTLRMGPSPAKIQTAQTVNSQRDEAPRLSTALAGATSATLDLARETSAPAARLGRHVLRTAAVAEPTLPVSVGVGSASEVLQSVGDRVGAGVRPISGSARNAFSFLLGPAPAPRAARSAPGA